MIPFYIVCVSALHERKSSGCLSVYAKLPWLSISCCTCAKLCESEHGSHLHCIVCWYILYYILYVYRITLAQAPNRGCLRFDCTIHRARGSFAQLLCLAGYDLLFHYYFIVCVLCGGGDSSGSNSRDGKCKMLFGDGNSTMTKNTLHIVDNKCCTILTF